MLEIIIVEDNVEQREFLREMISRYVSFEELDAKITLDTASPDEVMEYLKENNNGNPHLYFLDLEIAGEKVSGFKLASTLRENNPFDEIVFITGHQDLSLLAFEYRVKPLDYIIKENWDNVLASVRKDIKLTLKSIEKRNIVDTKIFVYKIRNQYFNIPINEIYYFESVINKPNAVIMRAKNQIVEFRGSLKKIEEYQKKDFFRCHKGYLVNLNKIASFDMNLGEVYFNSEKTIKCLVSTRKSRDIVKILKKF